MFAEFGVEAVPFHQLRLQVIGHATEPAGELQALRGGRDVDFPRFAVDELARLFGYE